MGKLISNELFSKELRTNNVIDFLSLSKSRLVTSRFPVASTTNVCPSVFTGNVNLRPVLSESGAASAKGMVIDKTIRKINNYFIMQRL